MLILTTGKSSANHHRHSTPKWIKTNTKWDNIKNIVIKYEGQSKIRRETFPIVKVSGFIIQLQSALRKKGRNTVQHAETSC